MEDADRRRAGAVLAGNQSDVLAAWTEVALSRLDGRLARQEVEADLRSIYDGIVAATTGTSADGWADMRSSIAELSRARARQGFSPTETSVAVTSLKDAVVPVVKAGNATLDDLVAVTMLCDELGVVVFESYVRAREQVISDQSAQLLELSTPVIKLWDGVVALPLIGTLDSARTQVVMENLLQALVDSGSEHAIIDITGVPAVDTQVAQHLLKTVVAARLMGAECIISGIRPQIAQTIVALGIQFGDIVTKATLADALVMCLHGRGLEVTCRNDPAR
jgi:rsbT co-antagonist protein RsbR